MELKKYYINEQTGISYTLHGDFYLPDIKLVEEEIILGKWEMLYKSHLEKQNKSLFNLLLIKGNLFQHCADVENQARDMFDTLIEQMKEAEGVTEELKEQEQLKWVQKMGNIENKAREIVCSELIYV